MKKISLLSLGIVVFSFLFMASPVSAITRPVVTVTPVGGTTLSGIVTFNITVTDSTPLDPNKDKNVWVYLYDTAGAQKHIGADVNFTSGTGTFTVDTTKLNGGSAWLDVGQVYDTLGNVSGSGDNYFKNYTIQNYLPVVTVTPVAGSVLTGTVTFTITVTDPIPLDAKKDKSVWVYLYDSAGAQKHIGADVDLSNNVGNFTVDTTKLDNGDAWLDVGQVYDTAGNVSGPIDNYFKDYTIENTPTLACNANASQTLTSDATTVNATDSIPAVLLSYINPNWTAVISGAKWIWSTDPVADTTVNTTKVFTKTFNITGAPLDSTLLIAADNTYTVSVNNVPDTQAGCSDTTGTTFSATQTCDIPASMLTSGSNTLSISVTNLATPNDSNPQDNPAGLLYSLTVNENDCPVVPTVTTNTASLIATTTTTVNGTDGSVSGDNTSFWWGTTALGPLAPASNATPEFPTSDWTHDNGLGPVNSGASFSEALTSLTPNTTYYYVAWVEVAGTWYPGQVLSFQTTSGQ